MGEQKDTPGDEPQRPTTPGPDGPAGKEGRSGAPPQDEEAGAAKPATPLTQQIGRVVLLLLLVLFGIFAATNAQPVDFSWVFGETEVVERPGGETAGGVPLIVLLVLSFVIGGVVGGGLAWQSARARRRDRETGSGTRAR